MDPHRARGLLAGRRAQIEHELSELSQPEGAGETDPLDPADPAPELVDVEVTESQVERLRDELEAIERAERRLAEGTYGLSVESGEPIPDGRLEAIPWAERTAAEQERYEGERG
jgi:DnaK suppressor protein